MIELATVGIKLRTVNLIRVSPWATLGTRWAPNARRRLAISTDFRPATKTYQQDCIHPAYVQVT